MSAKKTKNVEVSVNVADEVLTLNRASAIFSSLVKILAVQRNQIPFSYQTFSLLVNRVRRDDEDASKEGSWKAFQVEKQRDLAKNTVQDYEKFLKMIQIGFENSVQEAVILFGATIFTPKEIWHVEFPKDMKTNFWSTRNSQQAVDQIVSAIGFHKQLWESFSRQLLPTNMYLMLKIDESKTISQGFLEMFTKNEDFTIPGRCPVSKITIQNNLSESAMGNRFLDLSFLGDVLHRSPEKKTENCQWYECDVSVKGFKDVLVKGKSIWNL
uniref:Uncharacterized protein n=1 Tax=Phlebotomus papatasi TaxID=29031 RepID=A0A1B0DA30_PHLPP